MTDCFAVDQLGSTDLHVVRLLKLNCARPQHCLNRKRRAARLSARAAWLDNLDQRSLGHHSLYLVNELCLANFLCRQVYAQAELLRDRAASGGNGQTTCKSWACFAKLY